MLRKERTAVPGQIQLYSVEEVAELLDVSKKLVYAWVSDGALRAKRLGPGGRLIRVSRGDLETFINKDFKDT
jgi:excisionase family DNA binding protein